MARDSRKRIERIVSRLEPKLSKAFLDAVALLRKRTKLRDVLDAVARGDAEALAGMLTLTQSDAAAITENIRISVMAGGEFEAAKVPVGTFSFSGLNISALQVMQDRAAALVTGLNDGTRAAVREVMVQALVKNQGPKQTALDIVGRVGSNGKRQGGIIGLNGQQARALLNMKEALRTGDLSGYHAKGLRDKRFDRVIEQAFREGRSLDSAYIDKVAGRYEAKLLRRRGETIGREAIGYFNAGRQEGVRQMVEQEIVEKQDVEKVWHSTGDSRTRDTHQRLNGEKADIDGTFEVNGSRMEHPQDSSHGADPSETINCRCWMEIKIDFIAQRRRQRAAA